MDDLLAKKGIALNLKVIRGSEENVLRRFYDVSKDYLVYAIIHLISFFDPLKFCLFLPLTSLPLSLIYLIAVSLFGLNIQ